MEFYFAPLEGVTGFTYRNAYNDLFDDVDKYYAPFISPSINDRLKGKEIRDPVSYTHLTLPTKLEV